MPEQALRLSRLTVRGGARRRLLADAKPRQVTIAAEAFENIFRERSVYYAVTIDVGGYPELAAALTLDKPRRVDAWAIQLDGTFIRYRFELDGGPDDRVDPTFGGPFEITGGPGQGLSLSLRIPLSSLTVYPPSVIWSVTKTTSLREAA